jgi:4'-phosphopantetheinyl transferase
MPDPPNTPLVERFPDPNTVYVWHAAFDTTSDLAAGAMTALLDAEERDRAARFHYDRHRHRFVAAHAFLRSVLAWHIGHNPAEIVFTRTTHGKPHAPAIGLHFNLSHSHDAFACAVAQQRVGVDIEQLRPMPDAMALARRFFSPAEVEDLDRLESDRLPLCFFSCWTRKEAYVKAIGEGLAARLKGFTVSTEPGRAALLRLEAGADEAARWHLADLAVEVGYVGAVAVEGVPAQLIERWWPTHD